GASAESTKRLSFIFARCPVWLRLSSDVGFIIQLMRFVESDGPRGRVVGLSPQRRRLFSAGSRWPACLGTQRRSRPFGFLHDFAMVERSEFARLAENTAVHDDGVDIARLRQRDKRLVGVADRCHINIRSAD